jgi:hypothetical protein
MVDRKDLLMNAATAFRMLALTKMNPFTEADWMAFGGCVSENPLIGEFDEFVLVLDGDELEIYPATVATFKFSFKEM